MSINNVTFIVQVLLVVVLRVGERTTGVDQ